MPDCIRYIIIAPTLTEVKGIVEDFRNQGKDEVALLLENCFVKKRVYGNFPEDWKPFGCQTIVELIQSTSEVYESSTTDARQALEDNIDHNYKYFSDAQILIYFIDPLSSFLERYNKFAVYLDLFLSNAIERTCCFPINYRLDLIVQDELKDEYKKIWKAVDKHSENSKHRIVRDPDDLKSFIDHFNLHLEHFKSIIDGIQKKKPPAPIFLVGGSPVDGGQPRI